MKTDRELLELAAKAAGLNVVDVSGAALRISSDGCCTGYVWNPLTDDGDALHLAVIIAKFDRVICISIGCGRSLCEFLEESHGNDPAAATRRAIVRAAAAIGEAMS